MTEHQKLVALLDRFDEVTAKCSPRPWAQWFATIPKQEDANGTLVTLIHAAAPPHVFGTNEGTGKACCDADAILAWSRCAEALSAAVRASMKLGCRGSEEFNPEWLEYSEALAKLAEVKLP